MDNISKISYISIIAKKALTEKVSNMSKQKKYVKISSPLILPSSHLLKISGGNNNSITTLPCSFSHYGNSHPHSPLIYSVAPQVRLKPCQKFGLDLKKLEIQQLLKVDSYHRLYSIVRNAKTQKSEIFKQNLIKQLYFLLQIVPFMRFDLRDNFLLKIDEWYISNDNEKIHLSKSLSGMINNVLNSNKIDENKNKIRPKSGVQWDNNLQPFLRPYTGKISNKYNKVNTHVGTDRSRYRPISSKYGIISTKANTQIETLPEQKQKQNNNQDNAIGDYKVEGNNKQKDVDIDQYCDIKQQWERSQDFKKKYRTMHPDEDPPYQKLMNLISKINSPCSFSHTHNTIINPDNQLQEKPQTKTNKSLKKIQSASGLKKKNIHMGITDEEINNAHDVAVNQLRSEKQLEVGSGNEDEINQCQENEDSNENGSSSDQSMDKVNQKENQGAYASDRRTRDGRKPCDGPRNPNHLYTTVNGIKILRPYTSKQSNIINKLNTYSSGDQNRRVIQCIEDEQIAEKYREYVRRKTQMKKENVRRIQSARFMKNPRASGTVLRDRNCCNARVRVKDINGKTKEKQNKNIQNTQNKQNQKQKQSKVGPLFLDFSSNGNRVSSSEISSVPKYNIKTYFEKKSKQTIANSCRGIHDLDIDYNIQNEVMKLTHHERLLSEQRVNPFHKANIERYNHQIIDEIEKIKQKFHGKIAASSDALYRALYIDGNVEGKEIEGEGIVGDGDNQFAIPDKKYMMLGKGEKKKRRKFRKKKNEKLLQSQR